MTALDTLRAAFGLKARTSAPRGRIDATAGPSGTLSARRTGIDWAHQDGQTIIWNYALPNAVPLDYSLENLLSVGRLHELVNACLRIRADGLVTPPLLIERKQTDGTYLPEDDHPLPALLRIPGPTLDTATLWRCMSVSWDGTGLVYLLPYFASDGLLEEVHPLDPSRVTIVRDQLGGIAHFEYADPNGGTLIIPPDGLIIRRTVFWADAPPLATALKAAASDDAMSDYVRAFFEFAGVPSGIIKIDGSISKETAAKIQEDWAVKYSRAGTHAGAPAVLDENAEYQRVGAQLNELESDSLRANAETRVCMPFGVPPILIGALAGLDRATYSNYEQALIAFEDGTMAPLLSEWASWITRTLLPYYEDADAIKLGTVRARFDRRGLGSDRARQRERMEIISRGVQLGTVSRNEWRIEAGLEPKSDGDVYYIPTNAMPEPAATKAHRPVAPSPRPEVKAQPKPNVRLEGDVAKYLRDQYAKARRLWISGNDAGTQAVLAEIAQHLDGGIALHGLLAPTERKTYAASWTQAANQVDFDAVIDSGDVQTAVDALAHRCVGIADTTKAEIAQVIIQGAHEQRTDAEIARVLEQLGFERAKERAPLITRHELANASVTAATDAYQASGVVSELERINGSDPCPECAERQGERLPVTTPIDAILLHPACTCDVLPIVQSEVPA